MKKLSKKKYGTRLAREIELILVNHMASGECETSKMSSEITKLVLDITSGKRKLAKRKETEKAICSIIHAQPLQGQVRTVISEEMQESIPTPLHPMAAALAAAFEDYKANKLAQQQKKDQDKPTDLFPGFPGIPGSEPSSN